MSGQTGTPEAADQGKVMGFLSDSASHAGPDSVERVATHGNLVFLSGPYAWKIKRAVRFPYIAIGGHSGTGKTTVAPALAPSIGGAPGALGVPFDAVWLTADRDTLVARVAARRHDASDATPDVVDAQLQYEVGEISLAWRVIDAGGAAAEARQHAASQFGLDQ